MSDDQDCGREDEQVVVWQRRYTEARQAGLEHLDAIRFARSDSDIGELRSLVAHHCPPSLLRAIVL